MADYDKYRELFEASFLRMIQTNNNIDQNVQDISETTCILNAAAKSIPDKLVTFKSNDSPWITYHIKPLIRIVNKCIASLKKEVSLTIGNNIKSN